MAALMDSFSKLRPYKGLVLLVLCVISYLIGLSCVTKVTYNIQPRNTTTTIVNNNDNNNFIYQGVNIV